MSSSKSLLICCELLSDFVYSFFEHNLGLNFSVNSSVVNCFQIFYIRSLNTMLPRRQTQRHGCELLSDFVYSFFEHNLSPKDCRRLLVVNCFQILYIRSLNTIPNEIRFIRNSCELLSDFVYSFFEHNCLSRLQVGTPVVNCFQILYIRSLNTIGFV